MQLFLNSVQIVVDFQENLRYIKITLKPEVRKLDTINGRIIRIIEECCEGNRSEFARRIEVTPTYAAQLYKGERIPSDRIVSTICHTFNLRREWLEHGVEPMRFPPVDEDSEIINDLLSDTPSHAAEIIRDIYSDLIKLNEAEQDMFLKFIKMRKGKE